MPISYAGNPAGGSFASPAPGKYVNPALTPATSSAPADGDAATAQSSNMGAETNLDWLAYLQRQQALGDALGGEATSFDGSANPTTWNDMLTNVGSPISGLDILPTFAAGSGYAVTIGAGAGFLNTAVGIGAGESTYRSLWWASQTVVIGTPHASLNRIDAITVTPAAFGTASVLAVVAGTAQNPPVAPAIPAGSGAVFYVLVPAAAADATSFRACRGLWRRVGYPWAGMTGVLAGAEPSWDYTQDVGVGSASLWVGGGDLTGTAMTVNRVLIDGELIEWAGTITDTAGVTSDTTANPFGSTASASFDRPYYIYAVGGRHNQTPTAALSNAFLAPVVIVESTVPPNPKTGKPTANMTVNGVTVTPNGAVYIGLGFIGANTSHRRGCVMDGEMTYALNPLQQITHAFSTGGTHEDLGTFTGGSQPTISTKVAVSMVALAPAGAAAGFTLLLQNAAIQVTPYLSLVSGISAYAAASGLAYTRGVLSFTPRSGAELWAYSAPASGTSYGSLVVGAMGFNHRVNRICAAV